ncbi:unnamed protein product [Pylaiella littoralis]
MRAVQGYDWLNTRIFRHNNIPVLETTYQASFRIVAKALLICFRAASPEIQYELDKQPDSTLKV